MSQGNFTFQLDGLFQSKCAVLGQDKLLHEPDYACSQKSKNTVVNKPPWTWAIIRPGQGFWTEEAHITQENQHRLDMYQTAAVHFTHHWSCFLKAAYQS